MRTLFGLQKIMILWILFLSILLEFIPTCKNSGTYLGKVRKCVFFCLFFWKLKRKSLSSQSATNSLSFLSWDYFTIYKNTFKLLHIFSLKIPNWMMGALCLLYTGPSVQYKVVADHQDSEMRNVCVLILPLISCVILSKLWKLPRPQFPFL